MLFSGPFSRDIFLNRGIRFGTHQCNKAVRCCWLSWLHHSPRVDDMDWYKVIRDSLVGLKLDFASRHSTFLSWKVNCFGGNLSGGFVPTWQLYTNTMKWHWGHLRAWHHDFKNPGHICVCKYYADVSLTKVTDSHRPFHPHRSLTPLSKYLLYSYLHKL